MVCLFGEQFDLDAVALPTADRDVSGNGGGFRTGIQERMEAQVGGLSHLHIGVKPRSGTFHFSSSRCSRAPEAAGGHTCCPVTARMAHYQMHLEAGASMGKLPKVPWLLAERSPPGPPPEKVATLAEPVARQQRSLPHRKGQREANVRGRNHTGGNFSSCDNGRSIAHSVKLGKG